MDCTKLLENCNLTDNYRSVCHLSELFTIKMNEENEENFINLTIDNTIGVPSGSMDMYSPIFIQISTAKLHFYICSFISHILIIGITVVIIRKCLALNLAHTAEHACYCCLAFVFFLSESLLQRNSDALNLMLSPNGMNFLHSLLGLLSFGIGIVGVGVKTWEKRQRLRENKTAGVKHFRSRHAIFGLLGGITLVFTVLTGLAMYAIYNSSLMLVHRIFGVSTFLLSMTSQMMSYNTGFARQNWSASQITRFKLVTFIATITTINYEFRRLIADILEVTPKNFLNFTREEHA